MADADVHLANFADVFSLKGKIAVVTGGSRGLGLHAASGLLQAGCARVFVTGRRAAGCDAAVGALNALAERAKLAGRAYSVPADVSKVDEIERLVAAVGQQTGHVDILFANAGASWGTRGFEEVEEKKGWDKVMDLNLKGVFFTIQKFAPLLRKRGTAEEPSRVVVTSSIGGMTVNPGPAYAHSYVTSKAAVIHLARNLAVELAPRNILVNCIAPGVFPSKLANGLIEMSGGAEQLGKTNPNGRLGRPEDVAAAVVFLCSRAGSHVVGDVLVLDGGSSLAGPISRTREKL